MTNYSKEFKEEALKLSDEIGVKAAASQLGVPYYTLADWRGRSRERIMGGDKAAEKKPSQTEQVLSPRCNVSKTPTYRD